MRRNLLSWIVCVALVLIGGAQAAVVNPMDSGRKLTRAFYAGDMDTVWGQFGQQMRQEMGGVGELIEFRQQIERQLGAEVKLLSETIDQEGAYPIYRRTVRFEKAPASFLVEWAFESDGDVAGFFIKRSPEAASSQHLDYQTKADLRLPFRGEWYVFWGGKKIENNYHAASFGQRFAYDFVIKRGGSTHTDDGRQLEDFYCWGEPTIAPAAGVVAFTANSWPDNPPGKADPKHPLGNHVVIDHGHNEYSFLAHLQRGSVAVEEGEQVSAGDKLGVCGNSGNSSEPHLHYHMQTTAEFGKGQGLPAQFQSYFADGEFVSRGIPVRGQTVSPR